MRFVYRKDGPKEQRRHGQRDERITPIQPEHHADHAAEEQRVAGEGRQRAGDRVLHVLDVRREAGREIAGLLAIVETERKPLEVGEEIAP